MKSLQSDCSEEKSYGLPTRQEAGFYKQQESILTQNRAKELFYRCCGQNRLIFLGQGLSPLSSA